MIANIYGPFHSASDPYYPNKIGFKQLIQIADQGFNTMRFEKPMIGSAVIAKSEEESPYQSTVYQYQLGRLWGLHTLVEKVLDILSDSSPLDDDLVYKWHPSMIQIPVPDHRFLNTIGQFKRLPILREPYYCRSFRYTLMSFGRLCGHGEISAIHDNGTITNFNVYYLRSNQQTPDSKRTPFHQFRVPENYILFVKDEDAEQYAMPLSELID